MRPCANCVIAHGTSDYKGQVVVSESLTRDTSRRDSMCCEVRQELHCPRCRACPSDFTIRASTFWKDADVVCKCGHIVDSIYCFHCLDGGKKRLAEFKNVCNNVEESF